MEAGGGGSSLPPFLSKTYEMVDDPATDAVVAWTPAGTSFVVANQPQICRDLLPKYFKHNNFSSFVRQLNTYGFRKVDPEQWEFANEDFVRGQRHRMKNIHRRKPIFSHSSHAQGAGPLTDTEKRDYEDEIERLKCDNAALTTELQNNEVKKLDVDRRMQALEEKLFVVEDQQRNLISYVREIVKAPSFLSSFVQQPDHHRKKRRLPIPIAFQEDANTQENQIMPCDLTNSPPQEFDRESFDKVESSLNSLWTFLREASEAFGNKIPYDDGAPGPSTVLPTELHSPVESDHHVSSPPTKMCTSSAGAGDSHSSHDVAESTGCAENPLPQLHSHVDMQSKISEIDVNSEPAVTETGPSRDQPAEDPPAATPGANDGFWQQFLTEQPVSSDAHQEAQSERRDGGNKGDEMRSGDQQKFWWGKKNVEQITEKLGHLTSTEKT
ncbi:hypothetical protein GUJ93_ZPchr0007g3391 [Zizania palustris]|uniref:HSF-type DNA-binding domain-containing protein n=1 Tax=Zizania palustris TaxID=103762 RepID=A0A8J5SJV7_ZIZPA|nr:hypothetical protein GUJ93_ZPchr0007g3391 [Zizania palustris]